MTLKIFKINFNAPVHFGKKRLSDGDMTVAADTLFSALYIEALNLNMNTQWLLEDLILSDTFPFESEIYYLPKPLVKIESNEEGNHKSFKKLKYIPSYHYLDFIKGELTAEDADDLNEIFSVGRYGLQTKVSLHEQLFDETADSEPYSVGTFTFEEDCGLYFIAEGSNEAISNLNIVMNAMQYSGIGGKRYAGYGQFTYEIIDNQQLELLLKNKGNQSILLSTSMAKESEIKQSCENARYTIKKRSGFIQSDKYAKELVKKSDFYSFDVGAVFKNTFEGDVFNVGNDGTHPVYRYAKPLWLEV